MKKIIVLIIILSLPISVYAQRGCCSHHGGVAGCNNYGRQICNDGTLSPTCTCAVNYVYGCTNPNSINYDSNANKDDGSCVKIIYGCMDEDAPNYNSNANKDDGSCVKIIYGCMNKDALNYDSNANKDDGSCLYEKEETLISSKEVVKENNIEEDSGNIVDGIIGILMAGITFYLIKNKITKKKKTY